MEKKPISVQILNEKYVLHTDASEEDVFNVVAIVNDKLTELSGKKRVYAKDKLAVWAALDLAGELYQLRQDYDKLLKLAKER